MTPATARVLDSVADAYNPLLTLLALAAPWLPSRRCWLAAVRYYAAAGLAIAVVYLVMALDNHFGLWRSVGLDYSTHFAFASALVVSLSLLHRRWALPLLLSLIAYFFLALAMRYHGVLELLSAGAIAAPAAWLAQRWLRGGEVPA
jgi:hypothetical protein